ncbi:protein of unknown function [Pararobbsia alpina]
MRYQCGVATFPEFDDCLANSVGLIFPGVSSSPSTLFERCPGPSHVSQHRAAISQA